MFPEFASCILFCRKHLMATRKERKHKSKLLITCHFPLNRELQAVHFMQHIHKNNNSSLHDTRNKRQTIKNVAFTSLYSDISSFVWNSQKKFVSTMIRCAIFNAFLLMLFTCCKCVCYYFSILFHSSRVLHDTNLYDFEY